MNPTNFSVMAASGTAPCQHMPAAWAQDRAAEYMTRFLTAAGWDALWIGVSMLCDEPRTALNAERLIELLWRQGRCHMKVTATALLSVLLTLLASSAHSRTWNVRPDGTGDAPTIQAALDAAQAGDDVLLAPGTYTWTSQNASGNSMITMKSGIWLHSEAGPEATVLNAERQGRVMLCAGVDDQTRIEGLTITGGRLAGPGAGIDCENASPQIIGNVINDNHSGDQYYHSGGGIGCAGNSSPLISGNVISSNSACWFGGGISCYVTGSPTITRNTIRDNYAYICPWQGLDQQGALGRPGQFGGGTLTWSFGGGISCGGDSPLYITSNLIEDNRADFGAGIDCHCRDLRIGANVFRLNEGRNGVAVYVRESAAILSNTIVDNVASEGAMLTVEYSDGAIIWDNIICQSKRVWPPEGGAALSCYSYDFLDVKCNLLWDNEGGDGDCDPLHESNIHLDPLFCDAEAGDHSLQEGSPCLSSSPENTCQRLIGALRAGCEATLVEHPTWGRLKALYRR